jgi:hypothetical protein
VNLDGGDVAQVPVRKIEGSEFKHLYHLQKKKKKRCESTAFMHKVIGKELSLEKKDNIHKIHREAFLL